MKQASLYLVHPVGQKKKRAVDRQKNTGQMVSLEEPGWTQSVFSGSERTANLQVMKPALQQEPFQAAHLKKTFEDITR